MKYFKRWLLWWHVYQHLLLVRQIKRRLQELDEIERSVQEAWHNVPPERDKLMTELGRLQGVARRDRACTL